jgi:thiol peroxidase
LRRTYKCASFLSFCAPCIWSFLRSHPAATFYEIIKSKRRKLISKFFIKIENAEKEAYMPNVTLKGNTLVLLGTEAKVGQTAPDFRVQKNDLSDYTLKSSAGKTRIIASVPSLDTAVCDLETRRFNQEAAKLSNVEIVCVSMDLPFAQKRWCGAANVDKVITVSDHREGSFAKNYGVLISGGPLDRLTARAVFVVGPDDKIKYVEYVKEITEQPNYGALLAALK